MEESTPMVGDFYKQADGSLYQVKAIASNYGDLKQMIVYQAMQAPFSLFVMPLNDFLSDGENYRFMRVTPDGKPAGGSENGNVAYASENDLEYGGMKEEALSGNNYGGGAGGTDCKSDNIRDVTDKEFRSALLSGKLERNLHGKITEEQIAERGFLELLDARNCHEKREFFVALKPYLTRRMLENFAVTLDLVLDDGGDDEECFNTILSCIRTMEKYEGGHLRGE